ncbi:hypothetical protein GEMRC1_006380 [Eukaryota sp. GEM-RC1]
MDALLNQVVVQPKPKFGEELSTMQCAQFAATGSCPRGSRCKFSHDAKPKTDKINLYVDQRVQIGAEVKLEKITTEIVCKHFLDAVERNTYGYNWRCPTAGNDCIYRHCLPEGYVISAHAAALMDDEEEKEPMEMIIERERSQITTHTPVTDETFKAWKERKLKEKAEKIKESEEAAVRNHAAGKKQLCSGRQLWQFDSTLFVDQDDSDDESEEEEQNDDDQN